MSVLKIPMFHPLTWLCSPHNPLSFWISSPKFSDTKALVA